MKQLAIACLVVVLFVVGTASTQEEEEKEQFSGRGAGIEDSQTIKVLRDGKMVNVQLYGMEVPARSDTFGPQARRFVSKATLGKIVTVVVHKTEESGTIVGDVLLPDERNLSHALVKAGLAKWSPEDAPEDKTLQVSADAPRGT